MGSRTLHTRRRFVGSLSEGVRVQYVRSMSRDVKKRARRTRVKVTSVWGLERRVRDESVMARGNMSTEDG
jgi:hypothetical protein